MRVFLSSTYEDLKIYRQHIFKYNEFLKTHNITIFGMEKFGSRPNEPIKECFKEIGKSNIYIGIFGMRYGSVSHISDKSLTHLEYKEAERLNLPMLIYLIDEDKQKILPKDVDTGVAGEKLKKLKMEILKKRTVYFYTTPKDLAKRISIDLLNLKRKRILLSL